MSGRKADKNESWTKVIARCREGPPPSESLPVGPESCVHLLTQRASSRASATCRAWGSFSFQSLSSALLLSGPSCWWPVLSPPSRFWGCGCCSDAVSQGPGVRPSCSLMARCLGRCVLLFLLKGRSRSLAGPRLGHPLCTVPGASGALGSDEHGSSGVSPPASPPPGGPNLTCPPPQLTLQLRHSRAATAGSCSPRDPPGHTRLLPGI